jgi:hypothetical protein
MTVIHTNVVSIFGAETIHDLAGELAREYIVVPYGTQNRARRLADNRFGY